MRPPVDVKHLADVARIENFVEHTRGPLSADHRVSYIVLVRSGEVQLSFGKAGGDEIAMQMLSTALLDQEKKMKEAKG